MSESQSDSGGTIVTHGFLIAVSGAETLSNEAVEATLVAALKTLPGIVEFDTEYLGEIDVYPGEPTQ
jgi:hypothetical protein